MPEATKNEENDARLTSEEFHTNYKQEFDLPVSIPPSEEYLSVLRGETQALWEESWPVDTLSLRYNLQILTPLVTPDTVSANSLENRILSMRHAPYSSLPWEILMGRRWESDELWDLVQALVFCYGLESGCEEGLIREILEIEGNPYPESVIEQTVDEVLGGVGDSDRGITAIIEAILENSPVPINPIPGCYAVLGLPLQFAIHPSESGMSNLIAELWGSDIRYVSDLKHFIRWDYEGGVWRQVYDELGAVPLDRLQDLWEYLVDQAKPLLSRLCSAPGTKLSERTEIEALADSQLRAITSWSNALRTTNIRSAIIRQLRVKSQISIHSRALDNKPHLLNTENGTWDMAENIFRPHDKQDLLTQRAGVCFDPEAQAPVFERAMYSIFSEDPESLATFYRHLGATADGRIFHPYMVFLHGDSNNGKTLILKLMSSLFGQSRSDEGKASIPGYYLKSKSQLLIGAKNGEKDANPESASPVVAAMRGKRCVGMSEALEGLYLQEASLKTIVDNEEIMARRLFGDPINFHMSHTITLATNHLPRVNNVDDGIIKRVLVFTLRKKYKKVVDPEYNPELHEPEDDDLISKLESELSGILNYVMRGHRDWEAKSRSLSPSSVILEDTRMYFSGEDTWESFFKECVQQGEDEDYVPVRKLAQAYAFYSHGEVDKYVPSDKKVHDRIKNSGHMRTLEYRKDARPRSHGHKYKNKRCYQRITLKSEFESEVDRDLARSSRR